MNLGLKFHKKNLHKKINKNLLLKKLKHKQILNLKVNKMKICQLINHKIKIILILTKVMLNQIVKKNYKKVNKIKDPMQVLLVIKIKVKMIWQI